MSVRDRTDDGGWKPRPAPPPEAALDPATWTEGGRQAQALADLQARMAAVEGEVVALRAEVADLRAVRPT